MSITHANPLECIVQSQRKEIARLRSALNMNKELLQQALDALLGYKPHSLTHAKEQEAAVIALRAAISQPVPSAKQDLKWCDHCGEGYAGFCRGKNAAQDCQMQPVPPAEQELITRLAVLHQYEEIAEHYAKCDISPEALRDWVAERMDMPSRAQPERKPLRTSEILSMDIRGTNDEALRFARAIESAHGIGAKP